MYNIGLKLGSKDTQYTKDIISLYENGAFQYIELFTLSETYKDTINYWKQFNIPFGIHAPHSAAGMNLAKKECREQNKIKLIEVVKFADSLKAKYIIFHSGTNGICEEVVTQLKPFCDERFLIENKPIKGLDGSICVGSTKEELTEIISNLKCGFVLDFGHAICAANTLKVAPLTFIQSLISLNPKVFHLTDGDYKSELDSHLHYGKGTFPINELLKFIPDNGLITNEAKRSNLDSLEEFYQDSIQLRKY